MDHMFESIGKAFVGTISVTAIGFMSAFPNGLILMLGVGAVHGWLPAVPTTGYWTSVLIAWATRTVIGSTHSK
jgi:hypothetical protein